MSTTKVFSSAQRGFLRGILVGIVGCLVLFRKLLCGDPSLLYWADQFDARLLHWIAEWGYQVLFVRRTPLQFWEAPSFYPYKHALAFSDSLLSAQIFYSPLRMLGCSGPTALYSTLALVACISAGLTGIALTRLKVLSPWEQIPIIYACHFGLSIVGFLPHYQLFGFQLAFPFLLFLYLFLRDFSRTDAFAALLCFAFGACFATYLGPMLFAIALVPIAWRVTGLIRARELQTSLSRIPLDVWIFALVLGTALFFIQFRPYLLLGDALPPASPDEGALYSAQLTSFLGPAFGGNSYWYSPLNGAARFGDAERAFFPGYLLSYGTICFLLLWAARRWRLYGTSDEFAPKIENSLLTYLLIVAAVSILYSYGPYIRPWTHAYLPFSWAGWVVPGLSRVRAPGRFGIFAALPAAIFTVALLRTLFRANRQHQYALALASLLIFAESVPAFRVFPITKDSLSPYTEVQRFLPKGEPIIELPLAGGDGLKSLLRITEQLEGTLIHGGRIIPGYGATTTLESQALAQLDLKFQRNKARPVDVFRYGHTLGISYFLIRLDRYSRSAQARWKKALQHRDSSVVLVNTEHLVLLKIPPDEAAS